MCWTPSSTAASTLFGVFYPEVLTRGDLSGGNAAVDPDTFEVTDISELLGCLAATCLNYYLLSGLFSFPPPRPILLHLVSFLAYLAHVS